MVVFYITYEAQQYNPLNTMNLKKPDRSNRPQQKRNPYENGERDDVVVHVITLTVCLGLLIYFLCTGAFMSCLGVVAGYFAIRQLSA